MAKPFVLPPYAGGAAQPLDLGELLVRHPAATFFLRLSEGACGLREGDILVVDRSLEPKAGRLVVVALADELVLRRWEPERLGDGEAWGVVTWVLSRA